MKIKSSLLLLGASLACLFLLLSVTKVTAQPSTVVIQTSAVATTTVSYMTPGTATTTYQIDNPVFSSGKIANMQPIDSVAVYVQFAASSTSSILTITPQVSNNGIDWYNYTQTVTASPNIGGIFALASTSVGYQYSPLAAGTSSVVFLLPSVPTQHERVIYSELGANGAVYSEYDLKKNPSTP